MNKVVLLGRLTKDPEVRYTEGEKPVAVARYTLAVNRKYKVNGQAEADFINCVAFGKTGEFAEKYLKKGQQIAITGRLQVNNWTDKDGNKRRNTDIVVEEHYFCGGKKESSSEGQDGFYPISEDIEEDDLPF
ncbi:single-stranded DNA-binding protein [Anaerotignum lactatifermentans]|uniref:Single-stranded DNA-binding protein n=1 Tax=Anaerotignum lactatifermentans TaxID=160404 RepID=A0ABS2G9Q9_9FIRM|nr:single-stranded DNA-binding protein [Anaerotignum lactatifermentans]MBM6828490.1 single-stranded DNA-binding protein [Anaerotignum lactatifermentans]MBM6877897.1 single-stranded DNA-binding protein [Anaerotignum lactatifermentans]MBM6950072.1 single-stranded DNA-binding protein [Anaerotignum lactatifermentans]